VDDYHGIAPCARALALAGAAVILAACTGSPGFPVPVVPGADPPPSAENDRGRRVLATFVIRIPRAHRHSGPRYVSPSTKSASIVVDPGNGQTTVDVNLTLGSPKCTGDVCTIVINVVPGLHHFNISTYDGPLSGGIPSGNLLSRNLGYPFKVRVGAANQIGIVLQGIPAALVVTPDVGEDVSGSQSTGFDVYGAYKPDGTTLFPRTFTVAAADADGNLIMGAGAPEIAMTSSATSVFSNGVASAYSSNRVTVTPATQPAGYNPNWVPFTVSATPANVAGASPISITIGLRLMARDAPIVAVTDQSTGGVGNGRIWAFDESGKTVAGVQSAFDAATMQGPDGITYCASVDRFYAAMQFGVSIEEFESDGTFVRTESETPLEPLAIACDDSARTLFVANLFDDVTAFDEELNPLSTSGNWIESATGTVPLNPFGIAEMGGVVYVADEPNGLIEEYTMQGVDLGYYSIPAPTGLAIVEGSLYFSSRDGHDVLDLGYALPAGAFSSLTSPFGIVQDPANGYVYVVDFSVDPTASAVKRYDPQGDEVPLPAGAFVGPYHPVDIAISQ
jgi:hypothetical protein